MPCEIKHQGDNGNVNASCITNFGGNWNNALNAGVWQLNVNNSSSNTNANIGSHPVFPAQMRKLLLVRVLCITHRYIVHIF
jgi:hypothetical protein